MLFISETAIEAGKSPEEVGRSCRPLPENLHSK